jgi:tRNA1(Val) A37 N6-methylase TrmN6
VAGIVRAARRPAGWIAPGPRPAGARGRPELEPADDEDLCYLCGDFRVLQKLRGNRWSLDELVTADEACAATREEPRAALDLGCGIGSVLLMIAWRFSRARCVGVEAQEQSASLARRSIAYDGVEDRCEVRSGDLRDAAMIEEGAYDLVTGTPPYFRVGSGVEPRRAQCAPARFEHRGGVEEYCAAAARALCEGGRFVMCAPAREDDRVDRAAGASGLELVRRLAVVPREGKPALVSVTTMARAPSGSTSRCATLVVRDRSGRWTRDFASLRARMGLPPAPPARGQ